MEEKDINESELSNIEVSFTPETNEQIDKLDNISVDAIAAVQESKTVSIDESLAEITAIQRTQQSQNQEILRAVDNLSNIVDKQENANNAVVQDPVVEALNDFKTESADNNLQLIKEIQTINTKTETATTSNEIVAKFDELIKTVSDLKQNNVSNISSENQTVNSELLNAIEVTNNNLTTVNNSQTENNNVLNQSVLKQEEFYNNILEKNENQNVINNSVLEQIEIQNTNNTQQNETFLRTLNDINSNTVSQLSDISNENKTIINNQNNTVQELRNTSNDNNTTANNNVKILERFDNISVVQNENLEQLSPINTELANNAESLNRLQQQVSNISNNNTNTSTTTIKETAAPAVSDDLKNFLQYSVQIQGGMLQLLQQLVDLQSAKRYTDSPIKN